MEYYLAVLVGLLIGAFYDSVVLSRKIK